MSTTGGSARTRLQRAAPLLLLALGPGLWLAHLLLSYWFVPVTCRIGSVAPMHVLTIMAASGAVATAIGATVMARRARRPGVRDLVVATSADPSTGEARPRPRVALLELAATLAAYFALVIVVTGLVAVVGGRCA